HRHRDHGRRARLRDADDPAQLRVGFPMIIPAPAELAARYRISNGSRFRLKDIDPNDPWGKRLKPIAGEMLKQSRKRMAGLQERLYAQDRWSILLIFQAMDAAGKDGTIKHVMSGVN